MKAFRLDWLEQNENGYLIPRHQEYYAHNALDALYMFYVSLMAEHSKTFFKGYKNPHIEEISEKTLRDILAHAVETGYITRITDLKIVEIP